MTLYSATQIPHILKIMIGAHARHPRAPGAGRRARRSVAASARSSTCTPRSCCASPSPASYGVPVRWNEERTRERAWPPSTAAARSRTSSSPPTPTASSPAMRVRLLADMGAYLQLVTPGIPLLGAFLYAGVYDLPAAYDFECTSRVHHDDADRRLPRRRAPRGDVRHRAGDGRARRARSASTRWSCAGATSSRTEQFPYTAFTRPGVRLAATTHAAADEAARAGRLRRAARPAGDAERRRAPPSASGIGVVDATSRCAASRRRGAGLAELLGRRLGGGDGARPADRQGPGGHRHRRRTARATRRRGR